MCLKQRRSKFDKGIGFCANGITAPLHGWDLLIGSDWDVAKLMRVQIFIKKVTVLAPRPDHRAPAGPKAERDRS